MTLAFIGHCERMLKEIEDGTVTTGTEMRLSTSAMLADMQAWGDYIDALCRVEKLKA
jgi:hypothetical protein